MQIVSVLIVWVLSYVIGSIPFGLLIVRVARGVDVRTIGSGRTGGTNVMRAAGFLAGALTAASDVLKGLAAGWLSDWMAPGNPWVKVAAVLIVIIGQIHSIFLAERDENGRLRLHGGAGGATTAGGAMALWPQALLVVLPVAALVYIFVGYASVTTISIAVTSLGIMLVLFLQGAAPWQYLLYGLSILIVLYALRPNLKRLREGTERPVGLRAYRQKKKEEQGQ